MAHAGSGVWSTCVLVMFRAGSAVLCSIAATRCPDLTSPQRQRDLMLPPPPPSCASNAYEGVVIRDARVTRTIMELSWQ